MNKKFGLLENALHDLYKCKTLSGVIEDYSLELESTSKTFRGQDDKDFERLAIQSERTNPIILELIYMVGDIVRRTENDIKELQRIIIEEKKAAPRENSD